MVHEFAYFYECIWKMVVSSLLLFKEQ